MTRAASPASLPEALEILAASPDTRPVAGCTDLMVCEPEERADLPAVLDLLRIPEIRGVREIEGGVEIGAATTFSEIRGHPLIRDRFPALAEAAAVVGGWQIQNRATLGGNVVNASPAGDSLPVLLALDAVAVVLDSERGREIPYAEFHTGYRATALEPGELLAWLRLPDPEPGTVQLFRKVGTREAQAISKIVVALTGRVEDGVVTRFRLAAGSVAATPVLLAGVESEILGQPASDETADLAGRLAAAAVDPIDDVRSTADYRRFTLERVVRRLTRQLISSPPSS